MHCVREFFYGDNMRIGMVLESPFPPDIRVEKEIQALSSIGHKVFLLCEETRNQVTQESVSDVLIKRFNRKTFLFYLLKPIMILLWRITGHKLYWEIPIHKFIKSNCIEVLHIHDLPLALTGISAAHRAQIPCVLDLHETYPDFVRYGIEANRNSGKPFSFSYWIRINIFTANWWEKIEQQAIKKADRLIVVIEESRDRLVRMGIPPEKIRVVINSMEIDPFIKTSTDPKYFVNKYGKITIGYVGGIDDPNRGLANLIEAWPILIQKMPEAHLVIVGDGALKQELESLVADLCLEKDVTFTGWVPFEYIASHIKNFDIAVIPHVVNDHTRHTIPHKLFQYIAMGKPVVAADIPPIRRILDDTGAGIIVEEWSPSGFAEAFLTAYQLLQQGSFIPEKQIMILKERYGFFRLKEPLLDLYSSLIKTF
jgi:glycosyltransferase involved in cell wall biosynthesis